MHLRTKYFVGEDKEDKDTLKKIGLRGVYNFFISDFIKNEPFFPLSTGGRETTSRQEMKMLKRLKNIFQADPLMYFERSL